MKPDLDIILVLLSAISNRCHGYRLGPPLEACEDMFPQGHGVAAQSIKSPYSVTLNRTSYSTGDVIEVFLDTNNDTHWFFEGCLIQMRSVDCGNDKAVGEFSVQAGDSFLQTFDCFGRTASAVRHYSHEHIYNRTFYWHAPPTSAGHVYIRATVARNKAKFWTNVFSDYIHDTSDANRENLERCPVKAGAASAMTSFLVLIIVALFSIIMKWI